MKRYFCGVFLSVALASCGSTRHAVRGPTNFPRSDELAKIRSFEEKLGLDATHNLARYSEDTDAYHRCYYTEKLRLPDSYEELLMKRGSDSGCDLDEDRYDVFFYRAESVAGSRTPVTSALAEASEEQFTVVVAHEDFHRQQRVRMLPASFEEAAATQLGLLSGPSSPRNTMDRTGHSTSVCGEIAKPSSKSRSSSIATTDASEPSTGTSIGDGSGNVKRSPSRKRSSMS